MKTVKKAVIPAAGLGTRFLPATKTVPKEMLTIVDAPIIFYVVEEAISAGIEDIILIQGRGKTAIEDFFDVSYELEDRLAQDGKIHLLERLIRIREMVNIVSIRQKQPLGLGHAVLCAEPIVGKSPFAVLLGDEIMLQASPHQANTLGVLSKLHGETNSSAIAVMKVEDSQVSKYGIAEVNEFKNNIAKVISLIEKPEAHQTKSRWALPGRYILTPDVFDLLKSARPGKNSEIQLTDSLNLLASKKEVFASTFDSQRFDAGDKLGYLKANIEFGLRNPELASDLKKFLAQIMTRG